MRKPDTIEHLYLDFDSFFASVEQQRRPELRRRPVGITPSNEGFRANGVIAASKEAKARGVKSVMSRRDALKICPDMAFVPQDPALYRRAHNAARAAIASIVPVDARKSIDEMSCRLGDRDIRDPLETAGRIKAALADNIGPFVTASIGFAANRHLAKMACKENKPDGATVWRPEDLPQAMLHIPLGGIPGIGSGMKERLNRAGILTLTDLLATSPKQLRGLWGNVNGERFWYALHGYSIQAENSQRSMIGHGRVLPADWVGLDHPYECARVLLTKAARRLRRERFYARQLYLSLKIRPRSNHDQLGWARAIEIPTANDDRTCLRALDQLWDIATEHFKAVRRLNIAHVMLSFSGLVKKEGMQLDLLDDGREDRELWTTVGNTIDALNNRYGTSLVTLGPWKPPPGGNAGGKIAFTRVPDWEDFW